MTQRIAELPTFMNGTRAFGRGVTGDAAGERKLQEQLAKPRLVPTDVRIDFAVSTFEIGVADDRRTTVTRPRYIDHVEVVFSDHPVQMHIDEVLTWRGAPVS